MDQWEVILVGAVEDWYLRLPTRDAALVGEAIDLLTRRGPALGRPLVDSVRGSRIRNMKELRPGSSGSTEMRVLFVFDPKRRAVLLVAGDKAGNWRGWYQTHIPLAEERYDAWLRLIKAGKDVGD